MPEPSPAVRRALRARAHHLRSLISVGEAGITPAVLREIDRCLLSHELIKVRVLVGDRRERKLMIGGICRALGAHPIQHIGKILVIFRPGPQDSAPEPTAHAEKHRTGTRAQGPGRRNPGKQR